ncbi:MAG: DUF2306 domain-containing protein [Myxococcota bacterium]
MEIVEKLHVVAGFLALTTFWVPLVTRRGSRLHRRTGWIYSVSMSYVALSAILLGVGRWLGRLPGSPAIGLFLAYLGLFAGCCVAHGLVALRTKQRTGALPVSAPVVLLSTVQLLLGPLVIYIGLRSSSQLLVWFPLLPIFVSASQLRYWLRPPQEKMHWWMEHTGGMFAASIGTLTAFAVFGGPRLLGVGSTHPALWVAPSVLMVPLLIRTQQKDRARFAARAWAKPSRTSA